MMKRESNELLCRVDNQPPFQYPEVSVCTTVYNAERYIVQTIEGVLCQETSFPVEYVIADDCSTDNSSAIIEEYAKRFPKIIRFRSNKRNLGLNENFMATMRECRGKYIALLDGDDYWIDPSKLQMQHDFLVEHPECVLCGTATNVRNEQTGEVSQSHAELPLDDGCVRLFSTPEMYKLTPFWIPTHTVFLRARFVDFPPWFKDVIYVDRALRLILSLHGYLGFINKTTAVYRVHDSNASSDQFTSPSVAAGYLHTYLNFFEYSGRQYRNAARFAINHSIHVERRRIRSTMRGLRKLKYLLSNTLAAFRHFRVLCLRDVVGFPYHYMFIGDIVAALRGSYRFGSSKQK